MIHVHQALFTSVVIYFVVVALWGAVNFLRSIPPPGSFVGAVILGEVLIVVQAASGLFLLASGKHPSDNLHYLYALLILLAMPFAYLTAGQRQDRNGSGFYALAAALIVILAVVRATKTGG